MISLITSSKAQKKLAENTRLQRLSLQLTQQELAERSGVPLPTLRKFEQKSLISLESFLKLHMVLGSLEKIIEVTQLIETPFSSINEVLNASNGSIRKRGRRK